MMMRNEWLTGVIGGALLALCCLGCTGSQPQLNADGVDETDPAVAIEALDADAPKKYQSKK